MKGWIGDNDDCILGIWSFHWALDFVSGFLLALEIPLQWTLILAQVDLLSNFQTKNTNRFK